MMMPDRILIKSPYSCFYHISGGKEENLAAYQLHTNYSLLPNVTDKKLPGKQCISRMAMLMARCRLEKAPGMAAVWTNCRSSYSQEQPENSW